MRKFLDTKLYNNRLIASQMERLNKSAEQVAVDAGVSVGSVHSARKGSLGTLITLRLITDALEIKWEFITSDIPESQFHRAVVRTGKLEDGSVRRAANRGSVGRSNKQLSERVNGR